MSPRFTENSGGDGLYAFHLASGQSARGKHVSVISLSETNFTYRELGGPEPIVLGQIPRGVVAEHFYSARAAESLNEAIRLADPDIIHIHAIHQYFTSAAVPVLRAASRPIVYTIHDYKLLCGNAGFFSDRRETLCTRCLTGQRLNPMLERCKKNSLAQSVAAAVQMDLWSAQRFTQLIDVIHAPSTYVAELLSRNRTLRDKIRMVRHPFLLGQRTGRPPGDDRSSEFQVLFFGRLVPHKGAHIAIEAMRGSGVPLHVVGDGPDGERCRMLAAEDPNIHFHGWRTQSEIRELITSDTIALFPALTAETFCFAVVEAMTEGCCVVASGRGAIPELVRHGQNGWVVDPPTPAGFREAVMALAGNSDLRSRLATAASLIPGELATVDQHVSQIDELYSHAVQRNQMARR